jgi:cysteine desulfurase
MLHGPRLLDYNATTPLAPEVALAMHPFIDEGYGNPSSLHWAGQRARTAIEHARRQVASFLACKPTELIFTSGGTESNNAALTGVYFSNAKPTHMHFIVLAQRRVPSRLRKCASSSRMGP